MQFPLSVTHRQSMLPLLEAAPLFELIQALVDLTPAKGPNDDLLAKKRPVYSAQLI